MSRHIACALALLGAAPGMGCGRSPAAPERPGPPAALQIVTGDAQTGEANQVLPDPLTVQVVDARGRGLASVQVDWEVTVGGGALFARAFPTVTDSTGLVLVFWRLGLSVDRAQNVVAGCCGLSPVTFTAQAVPP